MTYIYMNPGDRHDTPAPLQQDDSHGHDSERDALASEVAVLRARVTALERVIVVADSLESTASICLQSLRDAKKRVSESVLEAAINTYLNARESTR